MSAEPVFVRPDPRVAVEHPVIRHYVEDRDVTMTDMLWATCTECGPLSDYDDARPAAKERLIGVAKAHANEVHDGLVEAVGWAR